MKYYSQYHSHELFELQESLSGLSKSYRWVKLADNLPWDKIEQECMKPLIRKAGQSVISPCGKQVFLFLMVFNCFMRARDMVFFYLY